jgi:hypothetical protein
MLTQRASGASQATQGEAQDGSASARGGRQGRAAGFQKKFVGKVAAGEASDERESSANLPIFVSVVRERNLDGAHGGRGWLANLSRSIWLVAKRPLAPAGGPDRS